jgi:hypothetical protein
MSADTVAILSYAMEETPRRRHAAHLMMMSRLIMSEFYSSLRGCFARRMACSRRLCEQAFGAEL